jgi:uncharacterized protein
VPGHVLLVFLKAPRPGQVKTRLAAEIGDEAAARVYRELAERVLAQTAPREREYERTVFFTPEEARAEVSRWIPAETLVAQEGADLGQRMHAAFAGAFARGATRAALIGTDVPRLARAHVLEAMAALDHSPVVLGPALDGGYYLVALREPRAELFRGVDWGTSSVRATTLGRAASLGLAVHLLAPLRDVDTAADLPAADPTFRAT